jgi:hypothetical protein
MSENTLVPAPNAIDRRTFTLEAALAILAGVTITISGCGSDSNPSNPSNPPPSPGSGDLSGTVSANHGHTAVITSAQLTAGSGVVLNIRGTATHNHTVGITASDLVQLNTTGHAAVSKSSSSDDGHNHTVTFS